MKGCIFRGLRKRTHIHQPLIGARRGWNPPTRLIQHRHAVSRLLLLPAVCRSNRGRPAFSIRIGVGVTKGMADGGLYVLFALRPLSVFFACPGATFVSGGVGVGLFPRFEMNVPPSKNSLWDFAATLGLPHAKTDKGKKKDKPPENANHGAILTQFDQQIQTKASCRAAVATLTRSGTSRYVQAERGFRNSIATGARSSKYHS